MITPAETQYELTDYAIDLTDSRAVGDTYLLPAGWTPLTVERQAARLLVILTRQTA